MDKPRPDKNRQPADGKRPSFKPIEKNAPRKSGPVSKGQFEKKDKDPEKDHGRKKEYAKGKSNAGAKYNPKSGKKDPELVRLNKHIAAAGICSRREADELIKAGLVMVNGKVVTEMGVKVGPGDEVRYNGERLKNEKKVYLVLNKPKDYVTTVEDPHATKTVMELIKDACHERVYPVGRLDRGTTGVLLFTNDGDLTKKLTHPGFNKKKIYHVHLNKNVIHQDLVKISEGVELDDGVVKADAVAYANPDSKREVGLEIHSGKNRVIRRLFEKLDYKVTKLDRVYFAGITKKGISRGKWRLLTEREISMIKMNAFE
jgi:23S rRNA pseudouridine2605 synthase